MITETCVEQKARDDQNIEARVLEGFDLEDVATACAVRSWKDHFAQVIDETVGDETHRFNSEAVLSAAVVLFQAEIRENLAVHQVKVAHVEWLLALMKLRAELGAREGIFPDEDEGERIVPERLAVIKVSKAEKTKLLEQVIEASRRIAEGSHDGEAIDAFPKGVGEGIRDFAVDLQTLISKAGQDGREAVTRICDDREYANEVLQDDQMPRPLRFLAQIVIETSSNDLPKKANHVGFGFGKR